MFAFSLAFSSSGPSNLRLLQAGKPPHTPTPAAVALGGSQGRERTLTRGLQQPWEPVGACVVVRRLGTRAQGQVESSPRSPRWSRVCPLWSCLPAQDEAQSSFLSAEGRPHPCLPESLGVESRGLEAKWSFPGALEPLCTKRTVRLREGQRGAQGHTAQTPGLSYPSLFWPALLRLAEAFPTPLEPQSRTLAPWPLKTGRALGFMTHYTQDD